MDPNLEKQLWAEAQRKNLKIDESFVRGLDTYCDKFFPTHPEKDRLVIQTYLADAGLRIAETEGKQVAEVDDAKAAIYYFTLPDDPDSMSDGAGETVLIEERKRPKFERGLLLNDNLRGLLDKAKETMRHA
jgi:hypothetical protein